MKNISYKKNILDLQFSKHLQYKSTAAVVLLSYVITLSVTIVTQPAVLSSLLSLIALLIISVLVVTASTYYLARSDRHLKRIPRLIGELEPNTKI